MCRFISLCIWIASSTDSALYLEAVFCFRKMDRFHWLCLNQVLGKESEISKPRYPSPRLAQKLLPTTCHPHDLSRSIVIRTGGADKSLARPTSRCRRTESIVSLERGVYSCAELQVFSCYRGWKETCQAAREFCRCSLFLPGRAK